MNKVAYVIKRIGLAGLASLAVASLGSLTWGPLVIANTKLFASIPWAVAAEGAALVIVWKYLGGSGWPRGTSAARHELLRGQMVPTQVFVWAWIAGALALVALAGMWIVLVQLTGAGGNPTLAFLTGNPAIVVALLIGMASLVSPLTEEAAFRGYGQVLLERRFSPVVAVGTSSLFFALYHGPTQGFAASKLAFYLAVGVVFGTTAFITRSTLPAIPVHIAGDLLFFTVIWPHDATRLLISVHGPDFMFWLHVAQTVGFGALSVLAFTKLRRATVFAPTTTTLERHSRRQA